MKANTIVIRDELVKINLCLFFYIYLRDSDFPPWLRSKSVSLFPNLGRKRITTGLKHLSLRLMARSRQSSSPGRRRSSSAGGRRLDGGGRRHSLGPVSFLRARFFVLVLIILVFVVCQRNTGRKSGNWSVCNESQPWPTLCPLTLDEVDAAQSLGLLIEDDAVVIHILIAALNFVQVRCAGCVCNPECKDCN